ncbi:MAG: protein kinase [Bryobacteraceae bacterium]
MLTPDAQLGPYRIETALGAGGMGQVYRARDTRLGRPVAIKILAEEFSHRFELEARAISGLNHPHICTLYDVGPGYLVMELVEGETLAARLQKGRLPLELALRYGAQMADALAAAHASGIIHRDLKPGNIMVTKSGVKVLDFGLAKITQADETVTASHAIQGTPAYMAPEQLAGKQCDARTDIFALGLVLYEMATGKRSRAAQGESVALDGLPDRFAHVVERCLEREPENRWQSSLDVKAELEWVAKSPASGKSQSPKPPARWTWAAAGAGFCAGLFVLGMAILIRNPASPPGHPARFILSFDRETIEPFTMPVPSPDGRYFVFSGSADQGPVSIWLRPLNSVEARPLPGTEGGSSPFWSPDGRWIGFVADGKLKKIDLSGGSPQTIAQLPAIERAAWGAKGDIIYQPGNRTPLFRIHESGGSGHQVSKLDRSRTENSHRSPFFLPDGRRFLFTARCAERENNALYIGSLDSSAVRRLMPVQSNVQYIPPRNGSPGALLYYRDSALVAQPFDADSEKLIGDAVPTIESVAYSPAAALASFEVSTAGGIVILSPPGDGQTRLTWFARNGEEIGAVGPRGDFGQPRLSPNGDRIAFMRPDEQTGNRDVWYIETARGVTARLTTHQANDAFPVWSPDGRQLVFGSDRGGGAVVPPYIKKSMDPGSAESPLAPSTDELSVANSAPYDWSQDGKWVSIGSFDIWVAGASGDRKPFPFLATPFNEGGARFSPDGKWIAYASDETGRFEVYVRPFAGVPATGEGKIQISSSGGDYPVWRADGQELFYMSGDLDLYAVSTGDLGRPGAVPAPSRLFRVCPETAPQGLPLRNQPYNYHYDTRDGRRFVIRCRAEPPGRFVVLMNWAAGRQ